MPTLRIISLYYDERPLIHRLLYTRLQKTKKTNNCQIFILSTHCS